MPEVLLIVIVGTALLLLLGTFIMFMTLSYQKKRLLHLKEVTGLVEAYQKEILQAKLEMQEQTLLSISQEIHDNIGQVLSLIRLNISTLPETGTLSTDQKLDSSKLLLDQALEDLRNLSKRLNSQFVTRQSLSDLLRFQLGLIQKSGAVSTAFTTTGEERQLNSEKKLILFRILQEALGNALRHAESTCISVHLEFTAHAILLSLCDDGKGFIYPPPSSGKSEALGTGIYNMRYRAGLIGADLQFHSSPGRGTHIRLNLPLNE